jgi:DNA (cytosine-5)-methyltransferase 1
MRRLEKRGLMPPIVLLENVVGLLSSREGEEFKKTCQAVAGLGYYLDAVIVDAKYFVPQSRPRLFIVGTLPEIMSSVTHDADTWASEITSRNGATSKKLLGAMKSTKLPTGWVAHRLPPLPKVKNTISSFIDVDDRQTWWVKEEVEKHLNRTSEAHRNEIEQFRQSGTTSIGTGFRRIRNGTTRVEIRFDGIAGCLRTANGGSARQLIVLVQAGEVKMRWMTPREYARLQGAPTFNIQRGINQSLTGFGDGVCVPVIEWVDVNIISEIYDRATARKYEPQHTAMSVDSVISSRSESL